MREFVRKLDVYFGLVDPKEPPPETSASLSRSIFALVVTVGLAALLGLAFGDSAGFAVFAAFVLVGTTAWDWWRSHHS